MGIKNLFLGLAAFNQQEAAPSAPSHLQWGWYSITTQISALPGWAARPRACAEPFHYPGWSVNKCLNYSCHVASVSLQKLQFTLGQTLHHASGTAEPRHCGVHAIPPRHHPNPPSHPSSPCWQVGPLNPGSSRCCQHLLFQHKDFVWARQVSVWSAAEKSPGEAPFSRIELKHLPPVYNGIITVLLSQFQSSSVEWPFLKYFSLILSELNFL